MIQTAFEPIFHLFNSFLPSIAAFMVFSAVMSALPDFGKRAKPQVNQPAFNVTKLKRRAPLPVNVKMYTMPTSMRSRTSRH